MPLLAIVATTPFLLDLSADGSNDNSGTFLLLVALIFFRLAVKKKNIRQFYISAVLLAVSAAFKHYVFFLLTFFLPYVFMLGKSWHASRRFFLFFFGTIGLISLPFIFGAPTGFLRALSYVELRPTYPIWGWNIWAALRDGFGIILSVQSMWIVRLVGTIGTALVILKVMSFRRLWETYLGAVMTMLVYLVLSWWTTYAHFTFLVPLIGLLAIEHADDLV